MMKTGLEVVLYGKYLSGMSRFMVNSNIVAVGRVGQRFSPENREDRKLVQKALLFQLYRDRLKDFLLIPPLRDPNSCEDAKLECDIGHKSIPNKFTKPCVTISAEAINLYQQEQQQIEQYTAAWERILGHLPKSKHFLKIVQKHAKHRSASEFESIVTIYKDVLSNEWILVRLASRDSSNTFAANFANSCEKIRQLKADPRYKIFQKIRDAFAIAVLIHASDPVKHLDEALAIAQSTQLRGTKECRISLYLAIRHHHTQPEAA